jgi:hypothetical protein
MQFRASCKQRVDLRVETDEETEQTGAGGSKPLLGIAGANGLFAKHKSL